jgi:epoxyqueuosine reductase
MRGKIQRVLAAPSQPDAHQSAAEIKRRARALGFDLVGITPAEPSRYREYLRQWLDDGRGGVMHYLERRFEERADPGRYLSGAASVICVAINYHVPLEPVPDEQRRHHARIARYALGDDYHEVLKKRLWRLADWLRESHPGAVTRTCVDTAPVMEKDLAARAGVGWVGKNTCVIHPQLGSWLLLGEIVTTLALPPDDPIENYCGTCRRCIDACPTGAITAPYQLDARRCISYLTIEHPEPIPEHFHAQLGEWLYGCDICQDVCPFNHKAADATDPALRPRFPTGTVDLRELLAWRKGEEHSPLRNSAIRRVKLDVLQRNARIVERNIGGVGGGLI